MGSLRGVLRPKKITTRARGSGVCVTVSRHGVYAVSSSTVPVCVSVDVPIRNVMEAEGRDRMVVRRERRRREGERGSVNGVVECVGGWIRPPVPYGQGSTWRDRLLPWARTYPDRPTPRSAYLARPARSQANGSGRQLVGCLGCSSRRERDVPSGQLMEPAPRLIVGVESTQDLLQTSSNRMDSRQFGHLESQKRPGTQVSAIANRAGTSHFANSGTGSRGEEIHSNWLSCWSITAYIMQGIDLKVLRQSGRGPDRAAYDFSSLTGPLTPECASFFTDRTEAGRTGCGPGGGHCGYPVPPIKHREVLCKRVSRVDHDSRGCGVCSKAQFDLEGSLTFPRCAVNSLRVELPISIKLSLLHVGAVDSSFGLMIFVVRMSSRVGDPWYSSASFAVGTIMSVALVYTVRVQVRLARANANVPGFREFQLEFRRVEFLIIRAPATRTGGPSSNRPPLECTAATSVL
ncbi:hypothetical protein R1flu_019862 [Riccia fluitans]|uniref:Uncharacterized protein n=1 Tax=Riccia fluitans TaxID=41844 RepID=A0ABD1ZJV8_9MARC